MTPEQYAKTLERKPIPSTQEFKVVSPIAPPAKRLTPSPKPQSRHLLEPSDGLKLKTTHLSHKTSVSNTGGSSIKLRERYGAKKPYAFPP